MAPAIKPTSIPRTHAMMIHISDSLPVVSLLLLITYAATSAAAFEIETIERSIPPVSIESITAMLRIAISGT